MELYARKSTGIELAYCDFKVVMVHKACSLKTAVKSMIK
jgi:hypothetical protein